MEIKEIKTKKLYKEYFLQIPFEDIDKQINEKIENLIPTVTIPGFRKGKAPPQSGVPAPSCLDLGRYHSDIA